jgi:hypothetical protein
MHLIVNTSDFLESNTTCETWTNEHVYFAEDVHFFNQTFAFVKIDSIDDLNITAECSAREFNQSSLKIFANENILLDNDLDLSGVVNIFNSSYFQNDVWFQNVKGFNENNIIMTAEKAQAFSRTYTNIRLVQITNVILGFYRQGSLVKSKQCKRENFDAKTDFFGQVKTPFLLDRVFYDHKICPYVFVEITNIYKKFNFDRFNEFFNLVYSLKNHEKHKKKFYLANFVDKTLSDIYEKKKIKKKKSTVRFLIDL